MRVVFILIMLLGLAASCGKKTTIKDEPDKTTGGSTGTTSTDGSADGADTTGDCTANCSGRECGQDGCGSFCGVCPAGNQCNAQGQCACNKKCAGKQCGSDGCEGTCGSCATGKACNGGGQCVSPDRTGCLPKCALNICGSDGCGSLCGKCGVGEVCSVNGKKCMKGTSTKCGSITAVGECQSNNGIAVFCENADLTVLVCDPNQGLTCAYNASKNRYDCLKAGCTPDCLGKECGLDGCGGACGKCAINETCNANGKCQTGAGCQDDCIGKTCGANGCGGQCGICAPGKKCGPSGQCIDQTNCTPNCIGKTCGTDGCGGSCGTCKPTEQCKSGKCSVSGCSADCTGKDCGSDGCGGSCGSCSGAQVCDSANHCVTPAGGGCGDLTYEGKCEPGNKIVKWCEGGTIMAQDCTKYGPDFVCAWQSGENYYWCLNKCEASCVNKECGSNECDGSCGTCTGNESCSPSGKCIAGGGGACGELSYVGICEGNTLKYCSGGELEVQNCGENGKVCGWLESMQWFDCLASVDGCTPNCVTKNEAGTDVPKECGDDGCGNSCGLCNDGKVCSNGLCTVGQSQCGNIDINGVCEGNTLKYCASGELIVKDCTTENNKTCEYVQSMEWFDCVAAAGTD